MLSIKKDWRKTECWYKSGGNHRGRRHTAKVATPVLRDDALQGKHTFGLHYHLLVEHAAKGGRVAIHMFKRTLLNPTRIVRRQHCISVVFALFVMSFARHECESGET